MKYVLGVLLALSQTAVWAHNHTEAKGCGCNKECQEKCNKGETKDCVCKDKTCECKKTNKCH